jgi:hypothetical protein
MESYQLCSQDITEPASAMLKVQASLQPAVKDQKNIFLEPRYATLNSVMDSCREAFIALYLFL